ncbi:MAG: imidazole glycerol phosphate synthase subunit HisH [Candidatus Nanopelagicales bacterium]|jgi:glutamine amidotransferase|nr:imidazole glycerol phosphate synthase subunit HisH [Candidatus Nanopelagicales bacterium]MCU0297801.1 imidazole glycerol phosphate synthase subunit HisH [Candidatus Nanopelagicales bacterium]
MKDVVVLDYGSGNLRSAQRALEAAGAQVQVTASAELAAAADGLVVPGVGAFESCARGLHSVGGARLIERRLAGGRPVLGICVGMQIMFEAGDEHGLVSPGCAQWPGRVEKLQAAILPHMGWNTVEPPAGSVLFDGLEQQRFYFVHSYAAKSLELADAGSAAVKPPLVTWTEYGERFVSAVENGPLSATQFHPEKSGEAGVRLLRNWIATL